MIARGLAVRPCAIAHVPSLGLPWPRLWEFVVADTWHAAGSDTCQPRGFDFGTFLASLAHAHRQLLMACCGILLFLVCPSLARATRPYLSTCQAPSARVTTWHSSLFSPSATPLSFSTWPHASQYSPGASPTPHGMPYGARRCVMASPRISPYLPVSPRSPILPWPSLTFSRMSNRAMCGHGRAQIISPFVDNALASAISAWAGQILDRVLGRSALHLDRSSTSSVGVGGVADVAHLPFADDEVAIVSVLATIFLVGLSLSTPWLPRVATRRMPRAATPPHATCRYPTA